MKNLFLILVMAILLPTTCYSQVKEPRFKRVITIIFENESYLSTISNPVFSKFAKMGANFTRFFGETHPSQPNYIAMTAGSLHGVKNNDEYDLDVRHIADLVEEKGFTWRVYAEDYPGKCFLGKNHKKYVRKHVPFISYTNITKNPQRCNNITGLETFFTDWKNGTLPNFSYVVPNQDNNAHDTDIKFAGDWFEKEFMPYIENADLMKDTLFVVTFDEGTLTNQIYTAFYGPSVIPGSTNSGFHNHYSWLKMIEDEWDLGNLGLEDLSAKAITGIWK